MEAHEVSYDVAGPILKRIQEVCLERNQHPIGSEMYVALDNQVDTLLTQLTKLFTETTAIYHNKFGTKPGEIDDSPDVPVSNGPNHFDLSGALGNAVNGEANLTEVATPIETAEQRIIREAKDAKDVEAINTLYAGKRTKRKLKKSKSKKSKRRR
jgi:ribosome-associated translation inhibitor RaiA